MGEKLWKGARINMLRALGRLPPSRPLPLALTSIPAPLTYAIDRQHQVNNNQLIKAMVMHSKDLATSVLLREGVPL